MVPKSKCDVWMIKHCCFYNNYYIIVNNQYRKGDEPVQSFFEGTVFMARCSRKPAQLSSHSELAANRIIQALVTLCTWQKYEDSWNKISCDWPKKIKLCATAHIACLSTISSSWNVEGWNAKNFAAYYSWSYLQS